jgi:C-terminal processing protease CtpA/Prc
VTDQGQLIAATCAAARPDLDREERLELERRREVLSKGPVAPVTAVRGAAAKTYAGNLVVLVDRKCAGSCESFVAMLKQLPHAIIVGENTAGLGASYSYRLPRSGIWMRASVEAIDAAGIQPDFFIDGTDPAAIARELAGAPPDHRP